VSDSEPVGATRRGAIRGGDPELVATLDGAVGRPGAATASAYARAALAPDASHYLMTPAAVVTPRDAGEVARLLAESSAARRPLTFRSGGTSLSGQASTDQVLVDTRRSFRALEVLDGGRHVRVEPGVTVRAVNTKLEPFDRKLGPDPASEVACTLGGVIANNSSGMACGVEHNTYRTIRRAIVVLASGTTIDTGAPEADEQLAEREPTVHRTLLQLRDRLRADPLMSSEVRRQFEIKNTMGYALNALLDFDSPSEILLHLLVGSEGTLGFVAEATLATVPLLRHAATSLVLLPSIGAATIPLPELVASGATTIELLDAASLRTVRAQLAPGTLGDGEITAEAALLIEYQTASGSALGERVSDAAELFGSLETVLPPTLTEDPAARANLWKMRKGLYASVAGARPPRTTALLEDIAVPVSQLSEVCGSLQHLFTLHGYRDAVIFGHAKDGNIHFLIHEEFGVPDGVARYEAFTEDMVCLVLGVGGTLKAEHGTGRIMAPFVRRQYGEALYEMMRAIKGALDPAWVLNPGAVLTDDPQLHLRHLKATPVVEPEVDRCVECGYCEPVCPSRDLTSTPRQRIVIRRAIRDAAADGDDAIVEELEAEEAYSSIATCAVDGMCETVCPVQINTGDLVRRLRHDAAGAVEERAWRAAARVWGPLTRVASSSLTVASAVPAPIVEVPNRAARRLLGQAVPLWSRDLPAGGGRRRDDRRAEADAVHFPSCTGSMFGPVDGWPGAASALASLAAKAGRVLTTPVGVRGLCCGMPWKSKGMPAGHRVAAARVFDSLWDASEEGRLPIVCESSSCAEALAELTSPGGPPTRRLAVLDATAYAASDLLPRLEISPGFSRLALHPTCSSTRAGTTSALRTVAAAVAEAVVVPEDWGCCAFAGDRGLLHPELTASATAQESAEVRAGDFDIYASSNRTCELAMSRATGRPYVHVLELLDACARPADNVNLMAAAPTRLAASSAVGWIRWRGRRRRPPPGSGL
jgi:D-lactate dehydrogenase